MKRLSPVFLLTIVSLLSSLAIVRADSRNLIVQTTPSDCGPAALATLLHHYLKIPATEKEMERLSGATYATGTTLLGLEKAAKAKQCAADSFRMDYATLQQQLETFAAPVIVSLSSPAPHFAVVLHADNDYVFLADPAIGNIVVRKKDFLPRWLDPASIAIATGKHDEADEHDHAAAPAENAAPTGYVFLAIGPDAEAGRALRREMVARLVRQMDNLQNSRSSIAIFRR